MRRVVHASELAISDSADGIANATHLRDAMATIFERGGRIEFDPVNYRFAPMVYPPTAGMLTLAGCGFGGTEFIPSEPSDQWMMDFDAPQGEVTHVSFDSIEVRSPNFGDRVAFKGIRVGPNNHLVARNCHARHVAGTAWQFERVFNGQIDIKTFRCGSDSDFALNLVGGNDQASNDVLVSGSTEQDVCGWNIESAVVLRGASYLKVHGGAETKVGLRLHRVAGGIGFIAANECQQELVTISDFDSQLGETQWFPAANTPKVTRLRLLVDSNANVDARAVTRVDLQTPQSTLVAHGLIIGKASTSGFYVIDDDNPNVLIDVGSVRYRGEGQLVENA